MPLSIFKSSGRASAVCGMAVEANRRPTINIVPRRIKPSEILVAHDGYGSNDTTAAGNTRFHRFPIRVQHWASVNWSQSAPAEGNPCVFKQFQSSGGRAGVPQVAQP